MRNLKKFSLLVLIALFVFSSISYYAFAQGGKSATKSWYFFLGQKSKEKKPQQVFVPSLQSTPKSVFTQPTSNQATTDTSGAEEADSATIPGGETISVMATAGDPSVLIVDNFNDGNMGANSMFLWTGGNAAMQDSYFDGRNARKIVYNGNNWYASNMWDGKNPATLKNVSSYKSLTFSIKGGVGNEVFKIELQYGQGSSLSSVLSSKYFTVTKSWQEVSIPLRDFSGLDTSKLRAISFVFNSGGTIYIDDLGFSTYEPPIQETGPVILIDDFNDANPNTNTRGKTINGNINKEQTNLYTYDPNNVRNWTHYSETNNALTLNYDCSRGDTFRYISNLWDGSQYLDVSNYDYISFRAKGEIGVEDFWVLFQYGQTQSETKKVSTRDYVNLTTEWQQVNIPLSAFSPLDKTRMRALIIQFDEGLIVDQGTVYLDNLEFSKKFSESYDVKPEGTGGVKIDRSTNNLLVNGGTYTIKGIGYSPTPIGSGVGDPYNNPAIYDRDFPLLKAMGCNTIRLWGLRSDNQEPGNLLMSKATEHGIKVIAGFWIECGQNFSDTTVRNSIKSSFRAFVNKYKGKAALLMWALGNECNYVTSLTSDYYSLCNELAKTAYEEEGGGYHPVMIINGELQNIGVSSQNADDMQLSYVDVWGANLYAKDFHNAGWFTEPQDIFEVYRAKSSKPLVITEYGADAFHTTYVSPTGTVEGYEDEDTQADWVKQNMLDIMSASDVCLGGCIMEYSDEWAKVSGGSALVQDPGPGYSWGTDLPDGYVNEEYWGIFEIAPDGEAPAEWYKYPWNIRGDGLDEIKPRKIYDVLKSDFTKYPLIKDIQPAPAETGYFITISGESFGEKNNVCRVEFTNTVGEKIFADTDRFWWNDTEIICRIPLTLKPGIYTVDVINWIGKSNPAALAIILPRPVIKSISRANGRPGANIWILGYRFGKKDDSSYVEFSDGTTSAKANTTIWDDRGISCEVPNLKAGIYKVTVVFQGRKSNTVGFEIALPPSISNIIPTNGSVDTSVSISGQNFRPINSSSKVEFLNQTGYGYADIETWNDQSIECNAPNLKAGIYNVTVINEIGTSNSVAFEVLSSKASYYYNDYQTSYGAYGEDGDTAYGKQRVEPEPSRRLGERPRR